MSKSGYTVSDVKRAFAEEGVTLLSREDVERRSLRPTESRAILLSLMPRVMAAVCDTPASAESMRITSLLILGRGTVQEQAKAVNANVAAFWPSEDVATGARIDRALSRLARQQ